eukprot:CAMPEP_0183520388 /NCGR_PEP_ID=MMETSP0371-20130417/16887_1 /TAXON_ID=268820 /ORGANISM="Peridinium aciculiferum, Strain PAER-2" /LENGTH=243 /DNA_ID=CAMNT_0025718749 /DNA_START=8 /DNA_END=737 /DNA_ORIENTATION=-
MYVSFAYSPAKEEYDTAKDLHEAANKRCEAADEKTNDAAKEKYERTKLVPPPSLVKWTKIGMPVILFSYLLLITGVCCFCFSTSSVNHIRYLYTTQAWFSQRVQYLFLIPALAVFTFGVPIWAYIISRAGKLAEVRKAEGRADEKKVNEVPVGGNNGVREVVSSKVSADVYEDSIATERRTSQSREKIDFGGWLQAGDTMELTSNSAEIARVPGTCELVAFFSDVSCVRVTCWVLTPHLGRAC